MSGAIKPASRRDRMPQDARAAIRTGDDTPESLLEALEGILMVFRGCSEDQPVVGGVHQILLGAEVPGSRPDIGVAEHPLDLLDVGPPGVAELGAGATKVMGPEVGDAYFCGGGTHDIPDGCGGNPARRERGLADQPAIANLRGAGPGVDSLLDPWLDCDGAHPPALAHQVEYHPAPGAALLHPPRQSGVERR